MSEPFLFGNGQAAYSAEDLIKLCRQFPEDSRNYLMREDFEKWLAYIGANKVAEFATEARQAAVGEEQKLDLFLSKTQVKPAAESSNKPKVNFFSAIAVFFMVLFNKKSNTENS